MLSFKQFLFLLENRIDFLKQQYSGKLNTEHDPYGEHKDSSDIIDHFANNADPTSNKSHTQWILKQYQRGNIRQEDYPRIRQSLSDFEKHKKNLVNKDIGSYKSLSDLEDAVEPHLGKEEPLSKKQESKRIKEEGSEIIHSSPNLVVRKLKTKEAACRYGAGTKWCTTEKDKDWFHEYNTRGPLYVIHHKDESGDRKFQYHPISSSLKDEKNESVDIDSFIKKFPELKGIKEFQGYHSSMPLPEEHRKELERELHHSLDNNDPRSEFLVRDAAKRGYLTLDHVNKIKNVDDFTLSDIAKNADEPDIHKALLKHPNTEGFTLDEIAKKSNDSNVHQAIINHPDSDGHTLNVIAKKSNDPEVQKAIIGHRSVNRDSLSEIEQKTSDPEVLHLIRNHFLYKNNV